MRVYYPCIFVMALLGALLMSVKLYGPLRSWFDQIWRPGEIELVKYMRIENN